MAIFSVVFCLFNLVACIIVSTSLVQGRSLRLRHGHRSHSDYYNSEESLPRDLAGRLEDDLEYHRDPYGQARRRGHPSVLDRSSEYEDSEDRVPSSFRRYRHEYNSRDRDESLRRREDSLHDDFDISMGYVARRKRHNKHELSHQNISEQNLKYLRRQHDPAAKIPFLHSNRNSNFSLELEVKKAQNLSICKYTVESIPDTRGSRVPKDLEHVRCNHIGSSCQGTYCCIQTYKNVEVSYGDGDTETIKLYVGCVCALQVNSGLRGLEESQVSFND